MSRRAQYRQQLRRPEKTRCQMQVARAHRGGETLTGCWHEGIGQQVESEGQRVRGLRVLSHAPAGGDERAVERGTYILEQLLVLRGVAGLPQVSRGARDQVCRVREVCGGDEVGESRGARIRRIVAVQCEPVTELPPRLPDEIRPRAP